MVSTLIDAAINTVADVAPQSFDPSSSSLAGALGQEPGPCKKHTGRAGRYTPYPRASAPAVHESEAGPSSQSLSTPPALDQATEADAEETTSITEEDQDTVSFFYCPRVLQLIVRFFRR